MPKASLRSRPRRAEPAQRMTSFAVERPPHVFLVMGLDPHPAESPAAVPPYVVRLYPSPGGTYALEFVNRGGDDAEGIAALGRTLRSRLDGWLLGSRRPRRAEPAQRMTSFAVESPPHVFRIVGLDPHPAESPAAVPPCVVRLYPSPGTSSEGVAVQLGAYTPLSTYAAKLECGQSVVRATKPCLTGLKWM